MFGVTADSYRSYGEIYNFSDKGYKITPATTGVYYNLSGLHCGFLNNVTCTLNTAANGGSYLQVHEDGIYRVIMTASISGAAGGLYGMGISKNYADLEDQEKCYERFDATGNYMTVSTHCFMNLTKGDNLTILFDDEANPTKELTFMTVSLTTARLETDEDTSVTNNYWYLSIIIGFLGIGILYLLMGLYLFNNESIFFKSLFIVSAAIIGLVLINTGIIITTNETAIMDKLTLPLLIIGLTTLSVLFLYMLVLLFRYVLLALGGKKDKIEE
jgi:hypothetical protein